MNFTYSSPISSMTYFQVVPGHRNRVEIHRVEYLHFLLPKKKKKKVDNIPHSLSASFFVQLEIRLSIHVCLLLYSTLISGNVRLPFTLLNNFNITSGKTENDSVEFLPNTCFRKEDSSEPQHRNFYISSSRQQYVLRKRN